MILLEGEEKKKPLMVVTVSPVSSLRVHQVLEAGREHRPGCPKSQSSGGSSRMLSRLVVREAAILSARVFPSDVAVVIRTNTLVE